MEFKKIVVNVNADTKTVAEQKELVAQFANVADSDAFVALVQRSMLQIQARDCEKSIGAVKDLLMSGETPTLEQLEKADNADMILKRINALLAEPCKLEHDSKIINILACHILGKPYALAVATVDKLLRDYHASLVDSSDNVTIDGTTQQKIITTIKQEVKKVLAVYATEKDSIFKKWSINLNNRDIVNLCSWFYADIVRDKDTGVFHGKYQTDGNKKINYAPLQAYLQRLVFMRLQHGTGTTN